jgi:phytoene dehydrogenase-like protein
LRPWPWLKANGIRDQASRAFIDGQLLISAQVTAERANALYGAIAMDLPRVGAQHVMGGIGNIAETLATAFRQLGGSYHKRQTVTDIEPKGRGYLVKTDKGLEVQAEAVLANLTPWGLAKILGQHTPPGLQRETQTRPDTWGAFTLYMGVDEAAVAGDCDHYQVIQDYGRPLGEGNSVFISLNDPEDGSRAPAGQRTVTMSTHTHIETWYALQAQDPEAYEARRAEYQENFLRAAEQVLPNIRGGIRFIMNGTPQTFQKFTRRPRGMVGGFAQTSLLNARGPGTGLPNLWLVGDSVFPGQSTAGVTAGAMRVAADVERALVGQYGASPAPAWAAAGD